MYLKSFIYSFIIHNLQFHRDVQHTKHMYGTGVTFKKHKKGKNSLFIIFSFYFDLATTNKRVSLSGLIYFINSNVYIKYR